jgi:23S rRNA (guanine1835-N2)-methyltransferase
MTSDLISLPSDRSTHPRLQNLSFVSATSSPSAAIAGAVFDTADEFLLHEFTRRAPGAGAPVLVVNDRYGAVVTALGGDYRVTSYGDSSVAFEETAANLTGNRRTCRFVPSTESLDTGGSGTRPGPDDSRYPFVLIRVPKSLALLEDQLLHLRDHLTPGAVVLCGGMDKHLSRHVNTLLDTLIGPSSASLGWRKARLIMAVATAGTVDRRVTSPSPTSYVLTEADTPPIRLVNFANVFSRNGLDQGTRTLLPFLAAELGEAPNSGRALQVADLGCGNGVIGILSALVNPAAEYSFFDESFMAVESARASWTEAFPDRPATFVAGNAMADTSPRTFDVILCNPPFHQDHNIGDETAWRMFLSAHRSLAPEGSLLVVGNRHLGYHNKLHRLFGGVELLGGNAKFVVLHARRK